jgi:hypothetical protein
VKIHILVNGARYDLHHRQATAVRTESDEE